MRNRLTHSRVAGLGLGLAMAALPMLAFAQTDTSGSSAGGLFGSLFGCICGLIGLAIWAFILYWVYTDAKKRGNPNALLWVIVCFFLSWIGLILYVLIGRNQGTTMGGPPPTGPAAPGGPSNTVRY